MLAKIFSLVILFGSTQIAQAQTVIGASPYWQQAGYLTGGMTLEQAQAAQQVFYANISDVNSQMIAAQKDDSTIFIAKSAVQSIFQTFQQGKSKTHIKLKEGDKIPYFKQAIELEYGQEEPATIPEEIQLDATNENIVQSIDSVQESLSTAGCYPKKSCPVVDTKKLPRFSATTASWKDYIARLEEVAANAKPPVNPKAVQRTVEFLKKNPQQINRNRSVEQAIRNRDYVVITDYTLDSTKKRMMVLNLKSGTVEAYHVSHGIGSGESAMATSFSDVKGSNKTPAGFMVLTNEQASANWGRRVNIEGLEARNKSSAARPIVMHASYKVGEHEIRKFGMYGFSEGCPQLSLSDWKAVREKLQGGVLMYNYTPGDK